MLDLIAGTDSFTDIEGSAVASGVIDRGAKPRWTRFAVRAGQIGAHRGT
jgi:hypothetical protein